ncbi:MAG TPA: hypothetical protein VK985_16420 [Rariglobus sp.]|nr:hypothetical protein [Rariglobus sp.]
MATSTAASRLIVELAPHSLQLAFVDSGGRMLAHRECAVTAAAVEAAVADTGMIVPVTGVLALVVPSAGFVLRANADEAASIRTVKSLLARAESIPHGLGSSLNVVAFDSVNGQRIDTVGKAPWVLAGVASEQVAEAKEKLAELGLAAAEVRLALPVELGAVVTALQDMPESSRVLVWQIGATDAQLACVSAGGCEAAGTAAVGYDQLFEAVQAGLGLKFRAAATKLFFNPGYDFSETAGPIAERLAASLRPAIAQLGCAPTVLHVTGLPAAQTWLAKAVAAALDLGLFAPKVAEFCVQCGLKGDASGLTGANLGIIFQTASGAAEAPWRSAWLDANAPVTAPVAAPAPVKPVAPAPAPVAVKPAAVVPVKPKPVPAPVSVSAAPAPAPVAAMKPAAVKAAPTPAPAPAAPVPVAKAPAPKPITPLPVVKPVAAPEPAVVEEPQVEVEAEAEQAPIEEFAPAPAKKPIALWATVAAIVAIGGVAVYFVTRGGGEGSADTTAAAAAPVLSAEEIRLREMEQARMLADEMKTPRSFRNDRYSFEVSDRGFLRKLVGAGSRTLIDEFGWLELQGTISGTSTPFTAGTMGDQAYVTTINKTVRDGKVVFEIKGVHPRFTMETLVTCLSSTLQIETTFKPLNMMEARGMLSGTYMVKMNRQSLSLGQRAVSEPGKISYTTQSGPVALKFNSDTWGPSGEAGKQAVMVASNLVFFDFAGNGAPTGTTLKAELTLP